MRRGGWKDRMVLAGAKLVMLSRRMFEEVYRIRDRITYRELMVDPTYMEQFTSACFLPHTDMARFPSAIGQHAFCGAGVSPAPKNAGETPAPQR